jgi:uridine phosphorylase
MLLVLQVVTVFLVGVAMSMALAHALEFPGKLRLDEQTYLTVQTIYYPGFTVGGIGEALAVIATLVLALAMRDDGAAFWWALSAFIAVLAMHVIFWLITQPTNRYWLRNQQMSDAGNKFFGVDRSNRSESTTAATPEWQRLRNRWEYSHIVRAVLSSIALVAVVISLAI